MNPGNICDRCTRQKCKDGEPEKVELCKGCYSFLPKQEPEQEQPIAPGLDAVEEAARVIVGAVEPCDISYDYQTTDPYSESEQEEKPKAKPRKKATKGAKE